MGYLARCNFIHRDVAARNVLVGLGKCKIADFGLAAHGTSRTSGSVVPLRWAAPESLKSRVWSEKSDVWSFGCLMYECVTGGALPYVGLTDNAVYRVCPRHRCTRPSPHIFQRQASNSRACPNSVPCADFAGCGWRQDSAAPVEVSHQAVHVHPGLLGS